jgi:uncharacterized protein Yka (UPF0111/DUF47 family)
MTGMHRPWFFSHTPDVVGLLREQVRSTDAILRRFAEWSSNGSEATAAAVRAEEHDGDVLRRALVTALQEVLSVPLDQEDLYVIADRLDSVQNIAKDAVRQAQVAAWMPDEHAARMAACASDGLGHLVAAFDALPDDLDAAGADADTAVKSVRGLEKEYRKALSELSRSAEPAGRIVLTADLYRRYDALGDAVLGVCHRVWFSVLKEK